MHSSFCFWWGFGAPFRTLVALELIFVTKNLKAGCQELWVYSNLFLWHKFTVAVEYNFVFKSYVLKIHTLQLNFLFSDWLFSKYVECIGDVHCTPGTAPRLREGLVVVRVNVTSTDPFFHWVKLLIFSLFIICTKHEQMIVVICCVWIRFINLHFLLLVK